MKFNPWHDAPIGENAPKTVEAIVEIPKRCKAKYELDKTTGMLRLDRVLFSSVNYPENYGFIPQTLGEDDDPLDIIVLSQIEVQPLCLLEAKVIGVMRMMDGGEADDKIIAVANHDKSVSHIETVDELPTHFGDELKNFFEDYKKLENKTVKVEEFQSRETAYEIIKQAIKDYNDAFGKNV